MWEIVYLFDQGVEYFRKMARLERLYNVIPRARQGGCTAIQVERGRRDKVVAWVKKEFGLDPIQEGEDTR